MVQIKKLFWRSSSNWAVRLSRLPLKKYTLGALFLILFFNGFVLWRWSVSDHQPLAWDQSIHTRIALDYRDRINEEGFFSILKPAYFNYPPLYHISLIPALGRTKDIADAGAFVNFFYLVILLLAVFLIAFRLAGEEAGLTAMAITGCYPILFDLAQQTMIDLALTSWITLSFYTLLKSENFTNKKGSIFFGIFLALGTLTKWTAPVYLIIPALYCLVRGWNKDSWKGAAWALGTFFFITLPWYSINFIPMIKPILRYSNIRPAGAALLSGTLNWFWYPIALPQQITIPFVILFLIGFILLIRDEQYRLVHIWILSTFVLFAVLNNRNLRYSMPALPACAILSVGWIRYRPKHSFRALQIGVVAFFIIFHFFPKRVLAFEWKNFEFPWIDGVTPSKGDWRHMDVLQKIKELKTKDNRVSRVLTLSNHPYLHSSTLDLSRRVNGESTFFFKVPSKRRWMEFSDFILVKTGFIGPDGRINKILKALRASPAWFNEGYREVGRWGLPDSSDLILYQVDFPGTLGLHQEFFNMELDELRLPGILAKHVKINAVPGSKKEMAQGEFKEIRLRCRSLLYRNIEFKDVDIRLVRPQINLPLFLSTNEIILVRLERLVPQATLTFESLYSLAGEKAKWLKDPILTFQHDQLDVRGKAFGIPLHIKVKIWVEEGMFRTKLRSLRLFSIPFPTLPFIGIVNQSVPLTPNRHMPFYLDIKGVIGSDQSLTIQSKNKLDEI